MNNLNLIINLGLQKLAYLHIVDHIAMGASPVGDELRMKMETVFGGTVIVSGGLDIPKAEEALQNNYGELASFGRPFISNPDLVSRLKQNIPLAESDQDTYYTTGEKGYTDYPNAVSN